MADEKDPLHSDDDRLEQEYRPSEHEYEAIEETAAKRSWASRLLNRRIITVVGLIIAVFVVYLFIGKPTPLKEEGHQITAAQTSILPATMPAETTQPTITQAPVSNLISGPTEMDTLKQQVQQNQGQIQQIQSGMQQLQTTVNQISNQMTSLTSSVGNLNQTAVSRSTSAVVAAPKIIYEVKTVIPPPPSYTVRAVVPGRAWLEQAKTRATLTVRTGDRLRGYGVITGINSRTGLVSTSSGRAIRIGPNDR